MTSSPALRLTLAALPALLSLATAEARELPNVDALAPPQVQQAAARRAGAPTQPARPATEARAADEMASAIARSLGASVRVSRHERLGVPSFIRVAPPPAPALGRMAAPATSTPPDQAARRYLQQLAPHYALTADDVRTAPLQAVSRTAGGGSLVRFKREIGGIEVFREHMTLLLDARSELLAVSGALGTAAGVDGHHALSGREIVLRALAEHGFDPTATAAALREGVTDAAGYTAYTVADGVVANDGGRFRSARLKKTYFRLPKRLVPAYYLETTIAGRSGSDSHGWVLSAVDGSVLFRNNLQAHAHSYRLWADTASPNLPLPGTVGRAATPFPDGAPSDFAPPDLAPALITPATADPWLAAGATETVGNNVDAYVDHDDSDTHGGGNFRADVTAPDMFDRTYDTGLSAGASAEQSKASITNLFYVTNFLHDWFLGAGFDEAAGNAQHDNYGRGGIGGDRMIAEAQDAGGRNNANMSTPADGASPRMQMYLFDGPGSASVTAGAPLGTTYGTVGTAEFGPRNFSVSGTWVNADPLNGCAPLSDPAAVTGKIAVIDRGACAFADKVANAEAAGAIGVVIVNSVPGDEVMTMGGTSATSLPALLVSNNTGIQIRSAPTAALTLARASSDIDGALDNTVIAHEWGHYLSNRLIGDGSGLTTNQARGMGEGWSDFLSLLLTVTAADALKAGNDQFQGAYAVGAHAMQFRNAADAYYRGIRRYPYTTDLTKNPLTLGHVANTKALPAVPAPGSGSTPDNHQVHNTGEVWASMLWECYAGLLRDTLGPTPRLAGFAEAQTRMKRYLVTGLKLTPTAPTITEARDALLAAMAEEDPADATVCAAGFAKRGAGAAAIAPERYATDNSGVVESFETGGEVAVQSVTLDDSLTSVDGDGYLDGGERGLLRIRYANAYAVPLTGLSLTASHTHPALTLENAATPIALPPLGAYQEAELTLEATLAAGVSGIQTIALEVAITGSTLAAPGQRHDTTATLRAHIDEKPAGSRFDGAEARTLPWTVYSDFATEQWSVRTEGSGANQVFHGTALGQPGLLVLQSPDLQVSATEPLRLDFRHRHAFEFDGDFWDGGALEISTDGGANWADLAPALYNGTITNQPASNPYQGLPAFVGNNAAYPGYDAVSVDLGTAYAGQNVRIRFVVATDMAVGDAGWEVDDILIRGIDNTPFTCVVGHGLDCGGLAVHAGDAQRATVSTAFATALRVKATAEDGQPAAGVSIGFTVQPAASGAAAHFPGAALTATAITGADGIAVAPTLVANATLGSFEVIAAAAPAGGFNGGTQRFTLGNQSAAVSDGSGSSARLLEGAGCAFTTPRFEPLSGAAAGSVPAGFHFPYGLFDFSVTGCHAPTPSVTIELEYPSPLPAGAVYWKFGRSPGNPVAHWYALTVADHQVQIDGRRIRFTLTDGELGDDDATPNGVIVDPGGVGLPAALPPGGGITPVPALTPWAALLLAAGVAGSGLLRRRRSTSGHARH